VYNFYFGDEYNWYAKVVHVVPGKELTWQMTKAMEDWMGTEVGFTLTQEPNGTSVLFFHKNWVTLSDHFAITTFCWGQLLNGLKNYLEAGIVIPFEKRN
jgi:Activator of Hsp90 ATPase homolog 1-like protein